MPTYTAYVTYTIDDSFEIEADSHQEAMNIADEMVSREPAFLPYSEAGGYTTAWDDANVYSVLEEEGDED